MKKIKVKEVVSTLNKLNKKKSRLLMQASQYVNARDYDEVNRRLDEVKVINTEIERLENLYISLEN